MPMRRATPLFFLLCLFVAASPACKPKVGGKCQTGQAACEDSTAVLACQGDVFVEAHCRGPGGCTKLGSKVTCDDSIGQEGEPCLETEGATRACSVDKKEVLLCSGGAFTLVQKCRGPNGCTPKGTSPACDATLAMKGEPCTKPGDSACSPDQKSRLVCTNGQWAFDRYCRGPKGCELPSFTCDEELSDIGDPCGTSAYLACGMDHMTELVCQGGQFIRSRGCKKGCRAANGRVDCQN